MIPITTNMRACLASIRWAEGTATSRLTKNAGFDVIVTGVLLNAEGNVITTTPEVFTDYSAHPFAAGRPPKLINSNGLKSTASGGYQELLANWQYYAPLLGLKDFSPASQDQIAVKQIAEKGALQLINEGNLLQAIPLIKSLWASFPGANYAGQGMKTVLQLQSVYAANGGKVAI